MEIHIRKKCSGFLNKLNTAQVQPHSEVLCRMEALWRLQRAWIKPKWLFPLGGKVSAIMWSIWDSCLKFTDSNVLYALKPQLVQRGHS